ncbi:hypothetical protein ACFQGA_10800 [Marinobacter koreensis]|uniref:hypothetical protein n=1 Tax=Marinobacter koreensis TaxID=335974 RepID=UPI0036082062
MLIALGGGLLLLLALVGSRSSRKNELPAWLALPYYFVAVNWYAVRGIVKALQGQTQVTWSSARPGEGQR